MGFCWDGIGSRNALGVVVIIDLEAMKLLTWKTTTTTIHFAYICPVCPQTTMESHGDATNLPKSGDSEGEKKAAFSFGFSKTVNKFKPTNDNAITKEETDYLTGIDGKELLRCATQASAS